MQVYTRHSSTRIGIAIVCAVSALATAGCASIITGSRQDIPINVQPIGTIVCIDGVRVGATPMIAKLERRHSHMIILEREGYKPAVVAVPTTVNPWIVGNFVPLIVIPGPIGLLVDVATGAVNELEPGPTQFTLQQEDPDAVRREREPCSPL